MGRQWEVKGKKRRGRLTLEEQQLYNQQLKEGVARDPENQKYNPNLPSRLNAPIIRKARGLFLQDYPYERIFLLTGLPYRKFNRLSRSWKKLRQRLDEATLTEIRKQAIEDQAKEFVEKGLRIGKMFLDRCLAGGADLSPKDFKLVMDSVMAIHRVKQLETGAPTDIAAYEHMTPQELREYLQTVSKQMAEEHGELVPYENPQDEEVH